MDKTKGAQLGIWSVTFSSNEEAKKCVAGEDGKKFSESAVGLGLGIGVGVGVGGRGEEEESMRVLLDGEGKVLKEVLKERQRRRQGSQAAIKDSNTSRNTPQSHIQNSTLPPGAPSGLPPNPNSWRAHPYIPGLPAPPHLAARGQLQNGTGAMNANVNGIAGAALGTNVSVPTGPAAIASINGAGSGVGNATVAGSSSNSVTNANVKGPNGHPATSPEKLRMGSSSSSSSPSITRQRRAPPPALVRARAMIAKSTVPLADPNAGSIFQSQHQGAAGTGTGMGDSASTSSTPIHTSFFGNAGSMRRRLRPGSGFPYPLMQSRGSVHGYGYGQSLTPMQAQGSTPGESRSRSRSPSPLPTRRAGMGMVASSSGLASGSMAPGLSTSSSMGASMSAGIMQELARNGMDHVRIDEVQLSGGHVKEEDVKEFFRSFGVDKVQLVLDYDWLFNVLN